MRMLLRLLAACAGTGAYTLIMIACFVHVDENRYAMAGFVTAMFGAFLMLGAEAP